MTYGYPYPSVPPPPPAAPKSRKKLWIILGIVAALLLICCCGTGFAGYRYFADGYPATLNLPKTMAGLSYQPNMTEMYREEESAGFTGARTWDSTVFGWYRQTVVGNAQVEVIGGAGYLFEPQAELNRWIDPYYVLDVDTGYMQCAAMKVEYNERVTRCGWATHGSLVLVIFERIENVDARQLMPAIRAAVQG